LIINLQFWSITFTILFFSLLQEPQCVVLGKTLKPVGHGCKRRIQEMCDCFYYCPILQTITVLINNKQFLTEWFKEPRYRKDGKLRDFVDGAVSKP